MISKKLPLVLVLTLLWFQNASSQTLTCDEAGLDVNLLCSLDEIDGFEDSMPATNPNDEPAPFCVGPGGTSGNPQNMTWFAFVATTVSAELELIFSNCTPGAQGQTEVQYGVYTNCDFTEFMMGTCQGNAVDATVPVPISLNNMIIGEVYYFFIDGDSGTHCDYSVDVVSGGTPIPIPNPTALNCISASCPDDGTICSVGESFTFQPVGLDIEIDYIWTVTPSPPNGTTINGSNQFTATFNNPGEYEICVFGDNGCEITDEVCYTLTIFEADAGVLSAVPETLCPGNTSTVTATDFEDEAPIIQDMIAVGPDGVVIATQSGGTIDITYDECGTVTVYSYNYNPQDSPVAPAVGSTYSPPNCNSSCCDIASIDITFEDTEQPSLQGAPVDITLECSDPIPDIVSVAWTDNCDGAGTVDGVQMDSYNTCDGGTITRTWEYTDGCDNATDYTQTITINEQDGGSFSDEPLDMTFDCASDIPDPIDLTWTGDCDGTAIVSPIDIGDSDLCAGGQVMRTWSYTDACGDVSEYIQTFTINPASEGAFIDAPADGTAACDLSDLPVIQDLTWEGDCEGTATVSGSEEINIDACAGGSVVRTWTYTDGCGATTTHIQTIAVNAPPLPDPVSPPPLSITINCDEIPTTFDPLTFTNGQSGDCEVAGTANAEIVGDIAICGGSFSVIWVFTDPCFQVSSYIQSITVLPPSEPEFIAPPSDMILDCVSSVPAPGDLSYTNSQAGSCLVEGSVSPTIVGAADVCGGDIVSTWEFTDDCGTTISHTQTISIEPLAQAEFIAPPNDITISCSELPPAPDDLSYTNSATGDCEIVGSVSATTDGSADLCGGDITYTWEFTDECVRIITHVQVVTVEAAAEAEFVDPPVDQTIGCDQIPPTPPMLSYTNSETGSCEIAGVVAPTTEDNSNSCGGDITYTWEFMDDCGRGIIHQQIITITEAPMPSFVTLPDDETVACNSIPTAAGPLSYTNSDPCEISGSVNPVIADDYDVCGGTITNTWEFTDECGRLLSHIQVITVEPAPVAVFQDLPANTTVACGSDATNPDNLAYTNSESTICEIAGEVAPTQSGDFTACGGDILFTWEFTDECNRLIQHVQTIVVEPAAPAEFVDPPGPITVSCADYQTTPPALTYTNSETGVCEIAGSVSGTVIGTPLPCGVDVNYRWEFTDDCGRTITHNQIVTIEEAPEATFTSPPSDITVDCADVGAAPPSLTYTNSQSGICAISGSTPAIQSGVFDQCGGDITYTWTFTDICNRTITHTQNVTINPAADPSFVDFPADMTLDCGEDFPINPTLDYTNGESTTCEIAGSVIATTTTTGNITEYNWEFTNLCNGTTIMHTQNVTGVPTPDITISPIAATVCLGEDFDLSSIDVIDAEGNALTITYSANGTTFTDPIVSPTTTTVYTIIAANDAGCSDDVEFVLNIDQPLFAGIGMDGQACSQGGFTENLFDYLDGSFTPGGSWFDTDGSGANINNPTSVSFDGVTPGMYIFTYTVSSSNSCPDASVEVQIEILAEIEFDIISAICEPGNATYTITVNSNGNSISSNPGSVNVIDASTVEITGIPITSSALVSAIDQNASCISDQLVNPPDCDCPIIPSPTAGENPNICQGDVIPELSVTVDAGLTTNWYQDETTNTALATNTLTYMPTVSAAGSYNFYVEAVDSDGCISLTRTIVTLTINEAPMVNNATAEICEDQSGTTTVDLQTLNNLANTNASFDFIYYTSQADAEAGSDALPVNYDISANTTVFVTVTNSTNCSAIAEIQIILEGPPTYSIIINPEICIDSMNGSINLSDIAPVGIQTSLDGVNYSTSTLYEELPVGSYTLYVQSPNECISTEEVSIEEGLELLITDLEIICDSNGTDSDSDDDFYDISFTLSTNNSSNGDVTISDGATDIGTFGVGMITFTIDAGDAADINITDVVSGCQTTFNTGPLTPCSTDCTVTIDQLDIECDGMGTDADPNDDVHLVTINASAVNGAVNNTFNVTVDGAVVANFEYGIGGQITIPAQGQSPVISIVDNADPSCFATQSIGPLTSCSDACIITIDNQNFFCSNEGTIGVPGDDTYEFSFTILGTNPSGSTFDLLVDGINVGTYNFGELSTYIMAADNAIHNIEFIDSNNPDCSAELTSPELIPCSGTCTINAIVQDVICDSQMTADDETDDTYTAQVFINIVGGSGQWSIPSTSQSGNAGETATVGPFDISDGNVTLEILDPAISGCTTTIMVQAPAPCSSCSESVEAGGDKVLSCLEIDADLEGVPSSAVIGTWTGPGGFTFEGNEVTVEVAGTYYYTADFGDGCVRTDSLEITVSNDIPDASAGEDQAITCMIDEVTLTGSVMGGSGNFQYQWLDEDMVEISTDISISVTNAGNYFFVVYDIDSDCSSPPSLVQVLDQTAPLEPNIIVDPSSQFDCLIEKIFLTYDDQANTTYTWVVDGIENTVEGLQFDEPPTGPVILMAVNEETGCSGTDQIVITTLEAYPFIAINEVQQIDCINTSITIDGSSSQSGDNITYTWYNEDNEIISTSGNMLSVEEEGQYYLELMDIDNGCTNIDSVMVLSNVDLPILTTSDDSSIACSTEELPISVVVEGNNNDLAITWSSSVDGTIVSNNNTPEITVSSSGTYYVTVLNTENQCESIDSVVISGVNQIENVSYDIMDESCKESDNGQIVIKEVMGGTAPYRYLLDGVELDSNIVTDLTEGTYNISIIDALGCDFESEISIEVQEIFQIDLDTEISVTQGNTKQINASVNLPDAEIETIAWNPPTGLSCTDCLDPVLTAGIENILYTLGITDINGCYVEDSIQLRSNDDIIVTIPNVFNPESGTSDNQNFTIYSSIDATVLEMQIYDRWGNLMFTNINFPTNDPTKGWNGKYGTTNVEQGVYLYRIELLIDGETKIRTGDITVTR